jgi:TRAP-type C4-dicarboxylate transport system permease small subunit
VQDGVEVGTLTGVAATAGWFRTAVVRFSRAISLLGTAVMGLMVLHITADVVSRYLFYFPLPGTISFIANYYMVAVTFLPLVVAERERQHIEVEIAAQKLPPVAQSVLRLAGWAITVGVFALLGWVSAEEAVRAFDKRMFIIEQSQRIEIWISYFMLPIGYFSSAIVAAGRAVIAVAHLSLGLQRAVEFAETYFGKAGERD